MDTFSLVIIVVVAGSFLYAGYNIWRTKKNGIETDAFVTRIEERESHDSDGVTYYDDYYVRYQKVLSQVIRFLEELSRKKGNGWIKKSRTFILLILQNGLVQNM